MGAHDTLPEYAKQTGGGTKGEDTGFLEGTRRAGGHRRLRRYEFDKITI